MSKIIKPRMDWENYHPLANNEIEDSYTIDENQLKNAKIFSDRYKYIDSLPKNLKYLEIGVAWGGYSEIFVEKNNPSLIHLLDTYNQYHMCWGQRYNGVCSCNQPHGNYTPENHQSYIDDLFSKYSNVLTIKGDSRQILPSLTYKYDYIYIDSNNDREVVTPTLFMASRLVEDGGVIGLNDYLIWDGVIEESRYGVVQAVHEFLSKNQSWHVDAIALHPQGFYDIYIKKGIMNVQGGD